MTPESYAQVKEIFAQASQLPAGQRLQFVRNNCDDDWVVHEVLSLLDHHQDETLLKTQEQHSSESVIETRSTAFDTSAAGTRIDVETSDWVDPYLISNDVWEENRQVLRRRLILIASVLATLVAISSLRLFTYDFLAWGYGARVLATASCALSALVLYRRPDLTLFQIRIVEFVMMVTFGFFLIVIDVRLLLDFADEHDEATLISVNNWHYFAWALIIFIYGVFMPNTWQRAAAILLPVAAIPGVVIYLTGWFHPEVRTLLSEDRFGQPLPTPFVAAVVSICAAHFIHGARLSAFQAKQVAQYHLNRLIGEGGMGKVYEAEHLMLKRQCAVKLISPEHCADELALRKFKREVRATAALTHPHTIEVYDFGETKDGVFYFAMEFLPGMNLVDLIKAAKPLPIARVVHFLIDVCESLAEAHEQGLVHRDVKPANIFASQRGGIYDFTKLLDFGVVRELNVDQGLTGSAGRVAGTPGFMSPEQIRLPKEVDARADLYGLGAVAYYLLTSRPPFIGNTPVEVILSQLETELPPPSRYRGDIPDDVEAIVMRCLAEDPDQRFASARQLQQALSACQCAGQWTQGDAKAWWDEHAPNLGTIDITPLS